MANIDDVSADPYPDQVRGCLLGGAIGDALGAPIEFWSLGEIRHAYGPGGITDLVPISGKRGLVTDDTQMTLFTCEGLIRAGGARSSAEVHAAYLRWLRTQNGSMPSTVAAGELAGEAWLYARRAPGNSCLSGLQSAGVGTLAAPKNPGSKGCGAVMRSAPFGLLRLPGYDARAAFDYAVDCAVQTHGHPTGYLAAGAFAGLIWHLVAGADLDDAAAMTSELLRSYEGHKETLSALQRALAPTDELSAEVVESLGGGWIAEEALAIAVLCARAYPAPDQARDALLLAANHSGDSDSTGAICGNLLGARYGTDVLPSEWVDKIEGRDTIVRIADKLANVAMT